MLKKTPLIIATTYKYIPTYKLVKEQNVTSDRKSYLITYAPILESNYQKAYNNIKVLIDNVVVADGTYVININNSCQIDEISPAIIIIKIKPS